MIQRTITESIHNSLFKGKVIVLYGARQVGKTTLVKEILSKYTNTWYITCDDPNTRLLLNNASLQKLVDLFASYKLVVIDEAQRIENIGITLKLIVDNLPQVQVIATGSSSFSLANTISEPLTGRKTVFQLYPFSWEEIKQVYDPIQRKSILERVLINGSYPEIFLSSKQEDLKLIVDSYLYQDILEHQNIKRSDVLMKLLQAIALQLGSEVSYHELSQIVLVDTATIERYVTLLEQCFVIFRLPSFSRNIRNELKKSKKIYFWDLGVRNTIINAMNPLVLRNDIGALWENFCISERLKYLSAHNFSKNIYFWRTKQQQEIDYIEEHDMVLDAFEFKWSSKKKSTIPENFAKTYNHTYKLINPENFEDFIS